MSGRMEKVEGGGKGGMSGWVLLDGEVVAEGMLGGVQGVKP